LDEVFFFDFDFLRSDIMKHFPRLLSNAVLQLYFSQRIKNTMHLRNLQITNRDTG
jgi:hypothetical protein